MRFFYKIVVSIFHLLLVSNASKAQEIVRHFDQNSFTSEKVSIIKAEFGNNKILIAGYEKQMLIALSYFPELKDIKIKFRQRKRKTPLASRPTFFSMFQSAKKRAYVITISKESTRYLDTITFKNLRFNAQIGVLGHELAHISNYINQGFGKMLVITKDELFCPKMVDQMELNTDLSCINHGLGYQLLDWSANVRENLERKNWLGALNLSDNEKSERYMNPKTILDVLNNHPSYNNR